MIKVRRTYHGALEWGPVLEVSAFYDGGCQHFPFYTCDTMEEMQKVMEHFFKRGFPKVEVTSRRNHGTK